MGSPLAAVERFAELSQLRYQCTFIEKSRDSADALEQRMRNAQSCSVVCDDHAIALPGLPVPSKAYGLVYADPNALKDAPYEAMRAFFSRPDGSTKMIDALININAHMVHRVVAGQKAGTPGAWQDLNGIMRRVGKQYWWIRQPFITAGNKWTFLFGSNTPNLNIKGLGAVDLPMFRIDSREGKQILDGLTGGKLPGKYSSSRSPYRSYREYLAHPVFLAVRKQVFERAAGICELCQLAIATEAHHRIYPAWGTFDHPDALVAVCHECHCKAHGVTQ
jgi:hypothetical protein